MSDEPEVIEQVADENKVDPDEDRKKSQALVQQGLSQLSKTADNTGYAYVNLNLEEKELMNLYDVIEKYHHLRYINASNNKISDISQFTKLESVLVLNCMKNEIQSLDFFQQEINLHHLQFLNLSQNKVITNYTKIKSLVNLNLPKLRKLLLNENEIQTCESFLGHPSLEFLDLSKNKLKTLSGVQNMPLLKELNLNENEITSVLEMNQLDGLVKLTMRQNQMDKLRFPRLPSLEELNVEANKVSSFREFDSLKSLEKKTHVAMKSAKQVNVKSLWYFPTQKCKSYIIASIHGEIITAEDVEEMIKEREEKKIQEEERLREEAIKRAEEEAERRRIEDEEALIRQKEQLEQQKIEEALREEERIKQEEQRIIDEKEREEREKQEAEEQRKRKEEEEEQERLRKEQELEEKLQQEKEQLKQLEIQELTPEEQELQKQKEDQQKHLENIEIIKKTIKAIPTKKRDQRHLFKNSQNPDTTEQGLTLQEIIFNFEKELDVTNEFFIYQPIKKAFDLAKRASPGEDSSTVQFDEFAFMLQYFKKYLEIMLVFQKFDINESQSISKDEFLNNLKIFENIGIDTTDPHKIFNEINTSQNDSLDFDELVSYIEKKQKLVQIDLEEENDEEQD